MTRVVVTARAERDVRELVRSRTLPADTPARIWRVLEPLRAFPELGAKLGASLVGQRFVLGPWRWMIVLYELDPDADSVVILRVLDGRTSTSPLANR